MPKRQKPTPLEVRLGNHSLARLLEPRPLELREHLKKAERLNDVSALEFLLQRLEENAQKTLKDDLPCGLTAELGPSDLSWAAAQPGLFHLSEKQESAVAVLMCAFRIRDLLKEFADMRGGRSDDKLMAEGIALKMAEEIALEAIHFAVAAIRGDFWANIWPAAKRGAAANYQRSKAGHRGVDKRKEKTTERKKLLQEIATRYQRHRSASEKAKFVQRDFRKEHPDIACPKLRTIRLLIK